MLKSSAWCMAGEICSVCFDSLAWQAKRRPHSAATLGLACTRSPTMLAAWMSAGREVGLALGGLGVGVAKQLFHRIERPPRVDKEAREGMTQVGNIGPLPDCVPAVVNRVLQPPSVWVPEQPRLCSKIHQKAQRNKPLTKNEKKGNSTKSRIRARIEHVFGAQCTICTFI